MATKASTPIRAILLALLVLVAGAAFIRPFGDGPKKATRALPPALPMSPEGFVLVDAQQLLERVKRTRASGVVVNAWASWCDSCKEELPLLLRLNDRVGSSIELLLVSVDDTDGLGAAAAMLRDFGARVPEFAVSGSLEPFKRAMNPKWTGVIPATFLFDRSAKLRYFWGGTVYENEIVPLLKRFLAGEHVDGESNFGLAPGSVTK